MQFMRDTARRWGVRDRANPEQSIQGAARYLGHLLRVFGGRRAWRSQPITPGEEPLARQYLPRL